jgi:hypothetical protein
MRVAADGDLLSRRPEVGKVDRARFVAASASPSIAIGRKKGKTLTTLY